MRLAAEASCARGRGSLHLSVPQDVCAYDRTAASTLIGGLVPSKISGVGTIFGLLVHVPSVPNKQRELKQSNILS